MRDLVFQEGTNEIYWQSSGMYLGYTESYEAIRFLTRLKDVCLSGTYSMGSPSNRAFGWSITFPVSKLSTVKKEFKQ